MPHHMPCPLLPGGPNLSPAGPLPPHAAMDKSPTPTLLGHWGLVPSWGGLLLGSLWGLVTMNITCRPPVSRATRLFLLGHACISPHSQRFLAGPPTCSCRPAHPPTPHARPLNPAGTERKPEPPPSPTLGRAQCARPPPTLTLAPPRRVGRPPQLHTELETPPPVPHWVGKAPSPEPAEHPNLPVPRASPWAAR